ncbi:MAG: tetratricopeptide repeat protein, partial [Patescibacteria group bacterium]|nr:tetratricopeptide repeat protein [Patescibacteria group bacterium]
WLSQHGGSPEERRRGLSGAAWSGYKLGKLPEAAALFQQLLDAKPPAPMAAEAALARGRILEELGQLDPALAMFDQVVKDHADAKVKEYPLALLAAARLHRRLDQHRQSAELYKRLADGFPDLADRDTVLYEWSWVLFDQEDAAASNALLAKLRAEHPKSRYWTDATYRLAVRGFQAKDYPAAAQFGNEIIGSDAQGELREHALYLLARIAAADAERDGKWDLVREHFERLLATFPNTPTRLVAEFWIAESLYRQQKFVESLAEFERLAQQTQGQPGDWLAMIPLRRAQLLAHQRKWNEAYAIASKIAEQFPGFQQQYEADYVVGRCLAALADFDGARQAYEKVINSEHGAKTETAAMAQWMIGETFFHQKQYDVAMREYLRVARLYAYPKWQAGSLLQGAKCRELLGEPEEAAKLYAEVLAEYADTPFAEQAKERLEAARSGKPQSPPVPAAEN